MEIKPIVRSYLRGIQKEDYVKLDSQPEVFAEGIENEEERALFLQDVAINPLKWWTPNGAQEEYITTTARLGAENFISVVLTTFANGLGKTTTSINIMLNIIFGAQNGWFDFPLFTELWEKPRTIWYISTAEAISGTVVPMIESFLPKDFFPELEYDKTKEGKSFVSRMEFPGGWILKFKTFDQDEQSFESANVGILIIDEPAPKSIWDSCKSRRRMGNLALLPMTPLYCPPYILDEIKERVDNGSPRHAHLKASVYEACKRRGTRGHLDPNGIDAMVEDYDPEEREARAFGEFMYFSGMIYKEFDKGKHVVEPEEFPIRGNFKIFQVVDPHDARPAACLWAARFENGRWVIFHETPSDQSRPFWDMKESRLIEDDAKDWKKIERKYKFPVRPVRILDKRFGWQKRGQTTLAKIYSQNGFVFNKSYTSNTEDGEIRYGHNLVRIALRNLQDGRPGLVIWNTCHHTINGLSHYIRRKRTGKISEHFATADGEIVDKYKDFPDIIRYLVASEIRPLPVASEKTEEEKFLASIIQEHDEDEDFQIGGVEI